MATARPHPTGGRFPLRSWATASAAAVTIALLWVLTDIPLCPLRAMVGLPCPGCGLSRATMALLRGDIQAANEFHPLVFGLLPLAAFTALSAAAPAGQIRSGAQAVLQQVPRSVWYGLLFVLLGVWAIRLAGGMGGHPDGIAWHDGLVWRVVAALVAIVTG